MTGTYAGQFVMEGFLDFKLPVWQRVMLTRSIAIVPAISVLFLNISTLTNLDTYLNITQSVQLPFALVPCIKFAASKDILGDFAIGKCQFYFGTILGIGLFMMNFILLFDGNKFNHWYEYLIVGLVTLGYLILIGLACFFPTSPLKPISKEDLEDHEYDRIDVFAETEQSDDDAGASETL